MTRELRIRTLALAGALPGALVALVLLWSHTTSAAMRYSLAFVVLAAAAGCAMALQAAAVRPVQTLSNMLAAIREGDYSQRGRDSSFGEDSFGLALREANAIAEALRGQRLDSLEASALLGAVMDEIEVAIFAFAPDGRLRFTNRAGAQLHLSAPERLLGRSAAQLGLAEALEVEAPRTMDLAFPSGLGRFEVRARPAWLGGVRHRLVVVSDLRRALREEEREAWQRLIRVLSHEINNSLTPIRSIAQSLRSGALEPGDLREGLDTIAGRADAVSRFMQAYARLARLPPPRLGDVPVAAWVRRVASLETRLDVRVEGGPDVTVRADRDQLDQLLINLIGNAVDATREAEREGVTVGWRAAAGQLELWVRDEGHGLPESANLFTPFFTTKKDGSGIGLVLSRQIAESHGGALTLANREDGRGAVATVRLPLG